MKEKSMQEVERKWLCSGFPDLDHESEEIQWQGYLSLQPAIRIRKIEKNDEKMYWLTIKGKGTISRTEVECPISENQFEELGGLLATPMAQKRLRRYNLQGGHVLECSVVDEKEDGEFYYAEVEFSSEEEAMAFDAPDFLGREVTFEPGYTMAEYCQSKVKNKQ